MDEQKAIESALKKVEAQQENLGGFMDRFDISEHWVVRHALEKQIAKKPRFYAHNYYCTECGNLVGNNEFEWQRFLYCDKCGQKLDWSEV